MKEDNNLEVKQTNSADYKPEIVDYKDVEHNNSSTLIDAFVNNNTIEESKEQEEIIEEQIKQDIIDSTLEETVKQKQEITYPFSFKNEKISFYGKKSLKESLFDVKTGQNN